MTSKPNNLVAHHRRRLLTGIGLLLVLIAGLGIIIWQVGDSVTAQPIPLPEPPTLAHEFPAEIPAGFPFQGALSIGGSPSPSLSVAISKRAPGEGDLSVVDTNPIRIGPAGEVIWNDPRGGDYQVTFTAVNTAGRISTTWDVSVKAEPVKIAKDPVLICPPGKDYTSPVVVTGTPPFTWELIAGPPGMTLDGEGLTRNTAANVVMPKDHLKEGETYTFKVRVTNTPYGEPVVVEKTYELVCIKPPDSSSKTMPVASVSRKKTDKKPDKKPDETQPAKPDETQPAKPDETQPAKPDETQPAKPDEQTPPPPKLPEVIPQVDQEQVRLAAEQARLEQEQARLEAEAKAAAAAVAKQKEEAARLAAELAALEELEKQRKAQRLAAENAAAEAAQRQQEEADRLAREKAQQEEREQALIAEQVALAKAEAARIAEQAKQEKDREKQAKEAAEAARKLAELVRIKAAEAAAVARIQAEQARLEEERERKAELAAQQAKEAAAKAEELRKQRELLAQEMAEREKQAEALAKAEAARQAAAEAKALKQAEMDRLAEEARRHELSRQAAEEAKRLQDAANKERERLQAEAKREEQEAQRQAQAAQRQQQVEKRQKELVTKGKEVDLQLYDLTDRSLTFASFEQRAKRAGMILVFSDLEGLIGTSGHPVFQVTGTDAQGNPALQQTGAITVNELARIQYASNKAIRVSDVPSPGGWSSIETALRRKWRTSDQYQLRAFFPLALLGSLEEEAIAYYNRRRIDPSIPFKKGAGRVYFTLKPDGKVHIISMQNTR